MAFDLSEFALENFFAKYEHTLECINLASSDVKPWTWAQFQRKCPGLPDRLSAMSLEYPDINGILLDPLRAALRPPPGRKILATNGAEESIFLALSALRSRNRRDARIAIPELGFGAYAGICRFLGFTIDKIGCESRDDWSISKSGLLMACASSRIVVVSNPHNPTGTVIPRETLREAASILSRKKGTLVIDEVFAFEGESGPIGDIGPNVIVIGSLSKVYGLPGIRLGWTIADDEWFNPMRTLQQYTTLSLNSFSVVAGSMAMGRLKSFTRTKSLRENRLRLKAWVEETEKVRFAAVPVAGTTAVLEIDAKRTENRLFEVFKENGVLLIPGKRHFDFGGGKPWFRVGYGGDSGSLDKGLGIIGKVLKSLIP